MKRDNVYEVTGPWQGLRVCEGVKGFPCSLSRTPDGCWDRRSLDSAPGQQEVGRGRVKSVGEADPSSAGSGL